MDQSNSSEEKYIIRVKVKDVPEILEYTSDKMALSLKSEFVVYPEYGGMVEFPKRSVRYIESIPKYVVDKRRS